jgi:transposase
LIPVETHREVFTWVLERLATAGLVKGNTIGVDATTLEANAALRSIVRRDSGESYQEFLTTLAEASGITTPTRAAVARLDRKRKKKGSNGEWTHPHDPDARITKMKDGRTHLAHKAEHAVDLDTGAIVGITVQGADRGDTMTIDHTLAETVEQLIAIGQATGDPIAIVNDLVADKGYHRRGKVRELNDVGFRTYISEPDLLVHASACNLGLWMRTACGVGTPRGLQGRIDAQMVVLVTLLSPSWLASRSCSVDKAICA